MVGKVMEIFGQNIQTDYRPDWLFLKSRSRSLQFFFDPEQILDMLSVNLLPVDAARRAAGEFVKTARLLQSSGMAPEEEVNAFWVPGRIEVLGKHTDYTGGLSLVAALERGVAVMVGNLEGEGISVFDAGRSSAVIINESTMASDDTDTRWGRYPRAVWRRLQDNFQLTPKGLGLGLSSNLPPAAGMSSSSALMVAVYLALHARYNIAAHPRFLEAISTLYELADYIGHIENGQTYRMLQGDAGVGTFGGSQDHAAILAGQARHISMFSFLPTRHVEDVALPGAYVFCIGCSGVQARKTGEAKEKYNSLSRLVGELVEVWARRVGRRPVSLAAVFDDPDFSVARFLADVPAGPDRETLERRLLQCYGEVREVIPACVAALKSENMTLWGDLVDRSQHMAEELLGNQVPETIFLTREARRLGAVAASAFGAGFGGSVWAMIDRSAASQFLEQWRNVYLGAFPQHGEMAEFFIDATGPGAFAVG